MSKKDLRDNRIRSAIDECLSSVEDLPSLRYQVLQKTRGDMKVKKKLSVGLIMAIILALVAVGAVAAALLSVKDLVEEQAIPMAHSSEGDAYSAEETRRLLTLADENGITLSEDAKEKISRFLSHGDGYYKEEMIMALAKAEFGPYPASWSLEEQKWFDDVCVAIGFIEQPQKALPGAGEISQDMALQKAKDYIQAEYGPLPDLDDPSVYRLGIQYINGLADGEFCGKYWNIAFIPLTLEASSYTLYLDNQGKVWDFNVKLGVIENAEFELVCQRYDAIYGWDCTNWDQSTLQAFQEAITHCKPSNSRIYLSLMETSYPDIDSNAISPEQAALIGAAAFNLDEYNVLSNVYIGDLPNPIWKITYNVERTETGDYYAVEIDSLTGEVKYKEKRNGGSIYQDIILKHVYEEVDRNWLDNNPGVG